MWWYNNRRTGDYVVEGYYTRFRALYVHIRENTYKKESFCLYIRSSWHPNDWWRQQEDIAARNINDVIDCLLLYIMESTL